MLFHVLERLLTPANEQLVFDQHLPDDYVLKHKQARVAYFEIGHPIEFRAWTRVV